MENLLALALYLLIILIGFATVYFGVSIILKSEVIVNGIQYGPLSE